MSEERGSGELRAKVFVAALCEQIWLVTSLASDVARGFLSVLLREFWR